MLVESAPSDESVAYCFWNIFPVLGHFYLVIECLAIFVIKMSPNFLLRFEFSSSCIKLRSGLSSFMASLSGFGDFGERLSGDPIRSSEFLLLIPSLPSL
jgi:hypothetical protein